MEKSVAAFGQHGSPFVYADPLNPVQRICERSALQEASNCRRCPAGSWIDGRETEVDRFDGEAMFNGEEWKYFGDDFERNFWSLFGVAAIFVV